MAPRLRKLSGADVIRALHACGFEVVNTRGSHAKLRRMSSSGDSQILTVPLHKELAPGTLHAIYRQAARFVPEGMAKPATRSIRDIPRPRLKGKLDRPLSEILADMRDDRL